MERIYYIYVWYRKDNNEPFYVGKGKEERYRLLFNRNNYFMNTYRKYGGYPKILVEGLTEQEAIDLEIKTIREYRSKYTLTNITDGGEGVSGLQHSKSTKQRLSELAKVQWDNPETREKLIKARRLGHSKPEARAKMSESQKGKVLSGEHRKKISESMKSPDVVEKLSMSHSKYTMIECITPNGESIIFLNTREATDWLKSKGYNARISSVTGCLNGKNKSTLGHKFRALNG